MAQSTKKAFSGVTLVFQKLFILAGLIVICSLGDGTCFIRRDQAAGLSARPSRADAERLSRKMEKLAAGEKAKSANTVEFRNRKSTPISSTNSLRCFRKGWSK